MSTTETLRRSVFLCSLPALLLSAACLLPYLDKAFLIDDTFFLLQAQQVLKAPLHPFALEICWMNDNECRAITNIAPPNALIAYCLAPVVAGGGSERLVHLLQVVVLWLGIAATVSLAFRLGFGAFAAVAAGLILAATPPVLAMASSAFPDVLAMSLGIIGVERLLAWKQEGRIINAVLSAIALGFAPFARVHLVLLWPIAALFLRDDTQVFQMRKWLEVPKRLWWPIFGGAILFVSLVVLVHEPGSGMEQRYMNIIPLLLLRHIRSYLVYWVLAMPLGLAWIVLRNRRLPFWAWWPVVVIAFVALKIWIRPSPVILAYASVPVGALVLLDVFLSSFKSRNHWRLACALWLLIPLIALPYGHLPVKYLVPCAPAVALLIAFELQSVRWRVAALCGLTAAGVIFASLILHADSEFAEMGRTAVQRLIAPRVAGGEHVWFASSWGFHWYALKAGARVLKTNEVPAPGDYLARGEMEGWPTTLKRLPPSILVDTYIVSGPGGRTMSPKDHAGLYTNAYGDYIWAWGTGEWNRYELWRFQ